MSYFGVSETDSATNRKLAVLPQAQRVAARVGVHRRAINPPGAVPDYERRQPRDLQLAPQHLALQTVAKGPVCTDPGRRKVRPEAGCSRRELEKAPAFVILLGLARWAARRIEKASLSYRSYTVRCASGWSPQAFVPAHGISGPNQEMFTVLHSGASAAQHGRASPSRLHVSPPDVLR